MAAESAQRTSIQSPPPDTARKTRRSERKAEAATATTTAAADHAPVTASRTRRLRGAHDSLNALGSLADAALQAHPMPEDELDDAVGEVAQAVTVEALRGAAQALQGKGGEGEDAADDEGVEDELGEVDDDEDEYEDGEEGEEDDGEGEGEGDEYAAPAGKRRKRSAAKQPKKEPRVKRAKPLAAPRNRWGRSQNDVDADLRTLLDTPDKAQAYLASKWIDAKELHRLEELRRE
jgi:hypothetical protein